MSVVGWDWASQAHDVTVLDDAGAVLDRWAFPHTEAGWVMALARLRPRQAQSPRHPHRRPRLDPRHLGLLAHRHPLRPRHPPHRPPVPHQLKT
jgi:hypothetical protein